MAAEDNAQQSATPVSGEKLPPRRCASQPLSHLNKPSIGAIK